MKIALPVYLLALCCLATTTAQHFVCSPKLVESYLNKLSNATIQVSQLVYGNLIGVNFTTNMNFSNITGQDSSTLLYSELVSANNITTTEKGLKDFKNALNEITNSYFSSCESSPNSNHQLTALDKSQDEVMNSFVQKLAPADKTASDYSNIRSDYGQLLCHQTMMQQTADDLNQKTKRKRRSTGGTLTDCASSPTIQELHECLDPFDVWPCIFNIDPLSNDCPSTGTTTSSTNEQATNCLAFVVDTTGSMAEEIEAAKQIVRQFIQSEENILTFCYVLVAFNDYWFNDPEKNLEFYKIYDAHYITSNTSQPHFNVTAINGSTVPVYGTDALLNDINGLHAHGGYDCPEFGMIGILKAIELINGINEPQVIARGQHNVIVLTDASAYDNSLYQYVIGNATNSSGADMKVHFFFSDDNGCSCCGYGNYPDIANATCGFAVHSIDVQAFTQFASYLYASQGSSQFGLNTCPHGQGSGGGNNTGSPMISGSVSGNCKYFNVISFVTSISLLIQGSVNNPIITITHPNGSNETLTINGDFTVYDKDRPQYGQWMVCLSVGFVVQFSVSFNEVRPKFVLHYVNYDSVQLYPTAHLPTYCDTMYFIIETEQFNSIDFTQPLVLQLVYTADDNSTVVIASTQLTACANTIIGSMIVPFASLPVYYRIEGYSNDGIYFQENISNTDDTTQFRKSNLLLGSSINGSAYISWNGQTTFKYSIKSENRLQYATVSTEWSLNTNESRIISSTELVQNITQNEWHHFDVILNTSLLDSNMITALTNQDINWTLTVRDHCGDQHYTQSIPVILAPLTIGATNSCSTDMTLTWNNDIATNITYYNVSLEFTNGTYIYYSFLTQMELTLSNLPYKESIEVRIRATSIYGGQQISYPSYTMWTNGAVPSMPRNFKVSQRDSSSTEVQLEWTPPSCWNSKSIHYIVRYKSEQQLGWNVHFVSHSINGNDGLVRTSITNLQAGENTFKIVAVNPLGEGIMPDEVKISIIPPRDDKLPTNNDNTKDDQSTGVIVIATVSIPFCLGIVIVSLCLLVLAFVLLRKQRKRKREESHKKDLWCENSSSSHISMSSLHTT